MKKFLMFTIPILLAAACVTPASSTGSSRSALTAADNVSCTATTTCVCSVASTPTSDAGSAVDSGTVFDAGGPSTKPDAGVATPDAGAVADAGTPQVDAGTPTPDAGAPADAGTSSDGGVVAQWATSGNKILYQGKPWMGKGLNLFDVRSCNNGSYSAPNWSRIRRNIDTVYSWGANFIRLDLEAYAVADGRVHYLNALSDPLYLQGLVDTVRHAGTKPGLALLVSVWIDPSLDANGLPSGDTAKLWVKMASALNEFPNVWYGIANEPGVPYSYNNDPAVWGSMANVLNAIRATETNGIKHIVTAQGTRQWGRTLSYYVNRPLGENVVYETHIYDPISELDKLLAPAESIPVIIGEFGPGEQMDAAAADELILRANSRGIPWLAWALHHNCPPNMTTGNPLNSTFPALTPWGQTVKTILAP